MLGYVHFDRSGVTNNRTEILVSKEKIGELVRNKYVRITNPADSSGHAREFLGRIVEGPFYNPEEVGRDSALAQTSILKGESFPAVPNYYAVGGIEILGELRDWAVYGTATRPAPQAKVEDLTSDDIRKLLKIGGDALLGTLDGYPDVQVSLQTQEKKVIPRNLGVFGTVGSGKTNTAQVIIEEASKSGYAVIILDVEGEYIRLDDPSEETSLHEILKTFDYTPVGLGNFELYYPTSGECAREDAIPFTINTQDLDPLIISELIEAEEAQERRLLDVVESLRKRKKEEKGAKEEDSLRGTLSRGSRNNITYTLNDIIKECAVRADEGKGADKASYYALMGKLGGLNRTKAFDVKDTETINAKGLLQDGHVTVFDVSGCAERLKNIVIYDLLSKVFTEKLGGNTVKALIVIEEAHSFISRDKSSKMSETIEMLREIARRGRKRWLGLCFISQQPSHLPNEIFELCNTRIVHTIKSHANLNALKLTAGDVSEEMWNNVPSLGTGQAVISSPQLRDPIVVNVRPCRTKREFVD
ncbi:MAG: ATP-binding protein [Dehalococcoidales bacterium]|nr:ATP-binding protein [Dehalococcoidales bacterium]